MNSSKIIIIGSGIAGLAAANRLVKQGYEVTILEASSRPGGRIWTNHSLGIPFDCGASWIHGTENNPVADLVNEFKLPTAFTDIDKFLFFNKDKKIIPTELIKQFSLTFEEILKKAGEYTHSLNHDIPILQALNAVKTKEKNLNDTLWDWSLRRISLITGAPLTLLSGEHWEEEELLEGGNYLMLSGYESLIKKFSVINHVQLNQVVKKIQYNKNGITITTQDKIFQCDKVIITVSLGVLKNQIIQFDPELPHSKLNAINKLKMGLLNKIALKFPKQFWPADNVGIYLPDQYITHFLNYATFWNQPILTAYVGGDEAAELEKYSDRDLVDLAMTQIKKYFGNTVSEPEKFLITRWNSNPYTYGSYSYIPVDASGDDYDVLAEPLHDQLFFAGEATNRRHLATVHGAYLSGVREAENIRQFCARTRRVK